MPKFDFIIQNQIGKGSFATVYKCKRKTDNKQYAIKQVKIDKMKQKDRLNALNEIRLLASINDPHVISYKQAFYDQQNSNLSIVMEYADGGDLHSKIKRHTKNKSNFKQIQIWKILYHLLKGSRKLHQLKIIHRDIKSANIFFVDGIAKLGDMNVSKIMKANFATTQTGTPYYASPQIWSDQPYGPKSDIWSIGIVAYEMCMLCPPFRAPDFEGLYKKIMAGNYQKINSIYSKNLSDVIGRLLTVDSKKRPTAQQVLKNPIFLDFELKSNQLEEYNTQMQLLQTIQMPKIYKFLNEKLPKPKYEEDIIKKQKITKSVIFEQLLKSSSGPKLPSLSQIKSQNKIIIMPNSTKNISNNNNLSHKDIRVDTSLKKIVSNKNIKVNKIPLKIRNGLREWSNIE